METNFKKGFISHRSYDYEEALRLRNALISNGICREVVLWENESLCYNYEQLTVLEFFNALDRIKRSMAGCDAFFIVDAQNYDNGYFTSAELLVWKYMHGKNDCLAWRMRRDGNKYCMEREELTHLSFRERHSMGWSVYYSNPDYTNMEDAAQLDNWGKYARNCYLVGCCGCGKYYLVSKGAMDWYVRSGEAAECPNCHARHARFREETRSKRLLTNRNPIVMKPLLTPCDLEHLGVFDLLWLMNTRKLDKSDFRLVCMKGEKFESDTSAAIKQMGIFMLGLWSVIGAGLAIFAGRK